MPGEEPFWAYVHALYDRMSGSAAEGDVTRVLVRLRGGEELSVTVVQPVGPWLVFETRDDDGRTRVVSTRPEVVETVEVGYVDADELDGTVGFQIRPPEHG